MNRLRYLLVVALALPLAPVLSVSAQAEDFTFQVPVQVTAIGAGTPRPRFQIGCWASRERTFEDYASRSTIDLVGEGFGARDIDASGNFTGVVTVAFNATNPALNPPSTARYYTCTLRNVSVRLPDGTALDSGGDVFETIYSRITGQPITRSVWVVHGEITPAR